VNQVRACIRIAGAFVAALAPFAVTILALIWLWKYAIQGSANSELQRLTVVISLANLLLVGVTWAQAKASADSVTEIRRDRELASTPYLLADFQRRVVINVGEGPALNARICGQRGTNSIFWSDAFVLQAGKDAPMPKTHDSNIPASTADEPDIAEPLAWVQMVTRDLMAGNEGRTVIALVCEGRLETKYRFWFQPLRAKPDSWPRIASPWWHRWPAEPPPAWTKWPTRGEFSVTV
jgi:hypothetical protein